MKELYSVTESIRNSLLWKHRCSDMMPAVQALKACFWQRNWMLRLTIKLIAKPFRFWFHIKCELSVNDSFGKLICCTFNVRVRFCYRKRTLKPLFNNRHVNNLQGVQEQYVLEKFRFFSLRKVFHLNYLVKITTVKCFSN